MRPNLKVQRFPNISLVCVNLDEISTNRLKDFISYTLKPEEFEGIAEIYAFIYENLSQPEWYLVQYLDKSYFVQRLGK